MLRPASWTKVPSGERWRNDVVAALWSATLAAVVIGPMAGKGWVVLLDWVTGPRVRFADRILAGDALPAGPAFFGLAAAMHGLFGAAVGWLVPAVSLTAAGIGAARLAGTAVTSTVARLTASTAYVWNPFVHERLYAGQLAVLLGYAVLPFVFTAAIENVGPVGSPGPPGTDASFGRSRRRGVLLVGITWAVATAASIHFAVLGAIVVGSTAVAECIVTRRETLRWLAAVVAVTGVVSAAWLVPRVAHAPPTGDERTIEAFATRPDPALGLAGGVAVQRGFWRPSPGDPSSDLERWWLLGVGALGGAALVGLSSMWRGGGRRLVIAVGLVGTIGWLLGQGGDGVMGLLYRSLTDVPGLRVMREAGKFIVLVSLLWAVGLAGVVELLQNRWRGRVGQRAGSFVGLGCALLPVLLTPGLAAGVGGRLAAVRYPNEWSVLADELTAHPRGAVIVLPFTAYFDPGFTGGRVVRSTARAYFGPRVIASDDSGIAGLPASARTRAIASALASSDPGPELAARGVGWLVGVADPSPVHGSSFVAVTTRRGWALYRNMAFGNDQRQHR